MVGSSFITAMALVSAAAFVLLIQNLVAYRAVDAGLVLTPGGVASILMMPLVGRLINKSTDPGLRHRAMSGFPRRPLVHDTQRLNTRSKRRS